MNPEIFTARKVYRWLWLSPLLTIPTLLVILFYEPGYQLICGGSYRGCEFDIAWLVNMVIAILGSALWHLVLLVPTLNKHSEFVRWHGRQALLLAVMRTAIPLAFVIIGFNVAGYDNAALMVVISILIVVWLFGTLWGQRQASRGDCMLMRWTGHGAALPLPAEMVKPVAEPLVGITADPLSASLNTIRFSLDPSERKRALQMLRASLPDGSRAVVPFFSGPALPAQDLTLKPQLASWVEIIRSSKDQELRRAAIAQLEKLGMIER